MENLYNAVLSFKGEGNFTFSLPKYGELTIYSGRDIYVKGLSVAGVEALRQLKPLLLEHKLNGKSDGCFRVIDLTALNNTSSKILREPLANPIQPIKSVADLKAEMIKSNGPIVDEIEENKEDIVEEIIEEDNTKSENLTEEEPPKKSSKVASKKSISKKITKKQSKKSK